MSAARPEASVSLAESESQMARVWRAEGASLARGISLREHAMKRWIAVRSASRSSCQLHQRSRAQRSATTHSALPQTAHFGNHPAPTPPPSKEASLQVPSPPPIILYHQPTTPTPPTPALVLAHSPASSMQDRPRQLPRRASASAPRLSSEDA